MDSRSVVDRYVAEVLTADRAGAADELLANSELKQRSARLRRAFPDLEVRTIVLLADHDLVAGHFRARGTHLGLFQGVPPTGASVETSWTAIFRVHDGRIADAWVTWDQLSLMEQLSAVERVSTVSA